MQNLTGSFNQCIEETIYYLKIRREVCEIVVSENDGCDRSSIKTWEQFHRCQIPQDLATFLTISNGFHLSWSIRSNSCDHKLGRVNVNSLNQMKRLNERRHSIYRDIPTISELESSSSDEDDLTITGNRTAPAYRKSPKLFVIDWCQNSGTVCLYYKENVPCSLADDYLINPEVWMIDRSLDWYYLGPDFSTYFKMALVYLGLPLWQYSLAKVGTTPSASHWINLFAAQRLRGY